MSAGFDEMNMVGAFEMVIEYNGSNMIQHPDYVKYDINQNNVEANALCLLQTDTSIFDEALAVEQSTPGSCMNCVASACLASSLTMPAHGSQCWIAGYGSPEPYNDTPAYAAANDNNNVPTITSWPLQQGGVNIFSDDYCAANSHWENPGKTDDQICAGRPNTYGTLTDGYGTDVCDMDTGSPMVCLGSQNEALLSGIAVMRENNCGREGFPGIYANISHHHDWINETMDLFSYAVTTTMPPTTQQSTTMPTTQVGQTTSTPPEFKPLTPSITPGLGSCGNTGNRIVGGQNAQANSWPWIVSLGFQDSSLVGGSGVYLCGGTIIENGWVLTAAHCCQGMAKVFMSFGQHNRANNQEAGEFTLAIEPADFASHVFIHDLYMDHTDGPQNFDVCLLKATVPDMFAIGNSLGCGDGCMNAACLPAEPGAHGDACWVAGWGTTSSGGSTATILQEVGVNLLSDDYCKAKSYANLSTALQPDELCAGQPDMDNNNLADGGLDACQGDSGGPLICDVNGQAVITGIVSWGYGCASEGFPGVYGEVFDYNTWIQDTMAQNP